MRAMTASGCGGAAVVDRDQMITKHMGLVHHMARRLARSGAQAEDLGDLVSGGTIGLIQAVDSFDPSHNLAFSTYAAPRIRGAMLDDMRSCDHASRVSRRRQRDVQRAERVLSAELEREPRHHETAGELGVTAETLWKWKTNGAGAKHVSLDDRHSGGSVLETVAGLGVADMDAPLERAQQLRWLCGRVRRLGERERVVLALYYVRGLKLREIGEVMTITESRVSQIRTAALARLRAEWNERCDSERESRC
jgi:RNA polymerase sigma factor FliA